MKWYELAGDRVAQALDLANPHRSGKSEAVGAGVQPQSTEGQPFARADADSLAKSYRQS